MRLPTPVLLSQHLLPLLLTFTVLWRGGKGLESTWLLIAVAGIILLYSFWRRSSMKELREPTAIVWWSSILFIAWTVVSFLFSQTSNYGLDEVLRDTSLILLFLWIIRFQPKPEDMVPERWRSILRALISLTLIAGAVGLFVYVFQPVNRFVGSFFYYRFATDYWPNAWAEFVLLTWPLFLLWAVRAKTLSAKTLRYVITGLVIGALFLSYSRGSFIAFVGQLVLLFALTLKRRTLGEWKAHVSSALIIAGVGIVIFTSINVLRAQFHGVQSLSQKVTFTAPEGASSFTERWQFWKQATELSLSRPLTGWGPYSFRFVQPRLQEHVLATSDHPHNVFLKLAMERGWPGVILFILILGTVLFTTIWKLVKAKRKGAIDVRLFLLVGTAGVIAHNLIDFNLQFVGIALPLWLLLGMIAPSRASKDISGRTLKVRRIVEVTLTVLLLIIATIEFRFLVLSSLGRSAETKGDTNAALAWYEKAENEVLSRDLYLSRALLYMKQNEFTQAQSMLDRYFAINSEDARAWKLQGELAFKRFDALQAQRSWREAFILGKFNDAGIVRGYLEALGQRGNRREITGTESEIMALTKSFAVAIESNTHFIALSPSVEEFDRLTAIASSYYPQQSSFLSSLAVRAKEKAREVRSHFSSRRAGYLW